MKKIILNASGNKSWIGGLYYIKNIAFELSTNESICQKYQIEVWVGSENYAIFQDSLPKTVRIRKIDFKKNGFGKLQRLMVLARPDVAGVFPYRGNALWWPKKAIRWIPDFQHNYYPEFFSQTDGEKRTSSYKKIANSPDPLVLSSQSCLHDFQKFYSAQKSNVYVVHFVSYIEQEIRSIVGKEDVILQKFDLKGKKYALVSNQFWIHKNHIVVFKAIQHLCAKSLCNDFQFVFTGMPQDDRNPDYYKELMSYINEKSMADRIKILGFVDRKEQIALMNKAEFIIQPSLFEGWGTVVEDAKVLDKTILLSDIPVHQEQMNDKCILFNPRDAEELANLIASEVKKQHSDHVEEGIRNMYDSAKEYSQSFYLMLEHESQGKQ